MYRARVEHCGDNYWELPQKATIPAEIDWSAIVMTDDDGGALANLDQILLQPPVIQVPIDVPNPVVNEHTGWPEKYAEFLAEQKPKDPPVGPPGTP